MAIAVERLRRGALLAMLGELLPQSSWAIVHLNRPRPFRSYRARLVRFTDVSGAVLHLECRDQLFRWRGWLFPLPGPDPVAADMDAALANLISQGRARIVHGPADLVNRMSRRAGNLPIGRWRFSVVEPAQLPRVGSEHPELKVLDPAIRKAAWRDLLALLRLTFPFEDRFVQSPGQLFGYLVGRILDGEAFVAVVDGRVVALMTFRKAGHWRISDHARVLPSQRGQFWSLRLLFAASLIGGIRPVILDDHSSPNDHSRERPDLDYGNRDEQLFIRPNVATPLPVRLLRRLTHLVLGSALPAWKAARHQDAATG